MTARDGDQPFPEEGRESDDEPQPMAADDEPLQPVSDMTQREWKAAARDVQKNWPKMNRWPE